MALNCRPVTAERFYYNRLFYNYIFKPQPLEGFFHYGYSDIGQYKKRIEDIRKSSNGDIKKRTTRILAENNRKLGASKKTMENIESLSREGSVAVIGGQQPGLFTGPLFVIYKVITVLKLSLYIQEKTGVRTVPCFWNASDDSGLRQADSLGINNGRYHEVKLDAAGIKKGTRLSNIYLPGDRFTDTVKAMGKYMYGPDSDDAVSFLSDTIDSLEDPDGNIQLAGLFSALVLKLFSKWGPVIIDPSGRDIKALGSDILKWDLDKHADINKSIVEKGRKLEKLGYHAQVEPNQEVLDFFISRGNARSKVNILPSGGYELDGKKYSSGEIMALTEEEPESVSWNVVLRPLVQDTILPVAATVCGPGEVSYFAQLGGIYEKLGMKMPVIYPRFSATIVEERTARLLKKAHMDTDILGLDRDKAEKAVFKEHKAEDVERMLEGLKESVLCSLEDTEDDIKESGVDTGSSFDRIKRNISSEIKVLSKKIYSAVRKQNQAVTGYIEKIYNAIFPEGLPQERKVNIFCYISEYGVKFVDDLYNAYDVKENRHLFIYLEGKQYER